MSTIAVFGASGQTGSRIVATLARSEFDVLAFSRQPTSTVHAAVRTAVADLSRVSVDDLTEALTGVDAVVFAAAGDPISVDRDGAKRVIDAAGMAGVTRFVLITGMGTGRDRPSEFYGGFWDTYFGAKEASERALQQSNLSWTILQPGELSNSAGQGRIELASTGSLPIRAISRDDVAAVVATILGRADSVGRRWELVSGSLNIDEAIDAALPL